MLAIDKHFSLLDEEKKGFKRLPPVITREV